jgi:hypothetical protein
MTMHLWSKAPGLYRKPDCVASGEIENDPPGESQRFLRKDLTGGSTVRR